MSKASALSSLNAEKTKYQQELTLAKKELDRQKKRLKDYPTSPILVALDKDVKQLERLISLIGLIVNLGSELKEDV